MRTMQSKNPNEPMYQPDVEQEPFYIVGERVDGGGWHSKHLSILLLPVSQQKYFFFFFFFFFFFWSQFLGFGQFQMCRPPPGLDYNLTTTAPLIVIITPTNHTQCQLVMC